MTSIGKALDKIIAEVLSSDKSKMQQVYLSEKDKQVSLSSKEDSEQTDNSSEQSKDNDHTNDDNDDLDHEALSSTPDVGDIIDKLNLIRSGKSLKDSAVESRFEGYFDDLDDAEKVALFAFLKGIAQIINGEIEPQLAQEPADDPSNVRMHKGKKVQNVQKKKNVKPEVKDKSMVKSVKPEVKKSSNGEEDSSPPIVVKNR